MKDAEDENGDDDIENTGKTTVRDMRTRRKRRGANSYFYTYTTERSRQTPSKNVFAGIRNELLMMCRKYLASPANSRRSK